MEILIPQLAGMLLSEGDLIDQPIGYDRGRDLMNALGEEDVTDNRVTEDVSWTPSN